MKIQHHIHQTAKTYGIKPRDLTGPSKAQKHVMPRHRLWLDLLCDPIDHRPDGSPIYRSLPAVARFFDDRDHTTVLYGARRACAELYGTPRKATLAQIREAVQAHMNSQRQVAA